MNRIVKNPFLPLILAFGMLIGFAMPSRAGTPTEDKTPKLTITWEEKRLSVDVVDTDIREVMKAISEKSGVAINVFEGVTGKVSLREEKAPLEKVVDRLLSAVGQRNYLMVYEGDGLRKLAIVTKGAGGQALSEEAKKKKVKGKLRGENLHFEFGKIVSNATGKEETGDLRTGKEIEYYPGEIVITAPRGEEPEDQQRIAELVGSLEKRFGLALIKMTRFYSVVALKFRILGGRDVLDVMYEIHAFPRGISATPNGLGPMSVEFPEEDFNVYRNLTGEELQDCRDRGLTHSQCRMEKMPFLRKGKRDENSPLPSTWMHGLYQANPSFGQRNRMLRVCNSEGCLPILDGIFFPDLAGDKEYWEKLNLLEESSVPCGYQNWRETFSGSCRPNDY